LLRHVALLNLSTQGKDNLYEEMDVSEVFREGRRINIRDHDPAAD